MIWVVPTFLHAAIRLSTRMGIRHPSGISNGIAATSHPIASSIAVDIMKKGGSAIDAAIAANAMLALVEPET